MKRFPGNRLPRTSSDAETERNLRELLRGRFAPAGSSGRAGLLDIAPAGGVLTPNYTSVTHNRATLSGSVNIAAPTGLDPVTDVGETFALILVRSGVATINLTWAAPYRWAAGVQPQLSPDAGAVDILTFMYDGQYVYGAALNDFLATPRA
jgi:hypothetical protein